MHTQLYGSFKKEKNIGASAEIDHDKDYFVTEHNIHFPVAIDTTQLVTDSRTGELTRAKPKTDEAFLVNGIPHLVVIDKSGIIRQVYVGWLGPDERSFLDTNTERVAAMIERLLKETTASASTR